MRPSCSFTPSPSPVTRLQLWKSPMPYLFGGEEKQAMPMNMVVDTEPKIVVIMAGDDKPTYLAKPVTFSTCSIELV
uniref:Uncharacterized protein n=1 Tax=Quercus lobata TaxID=97700 RepID=A0A7N2QZH0_QUELO